MLTIFQVLTLVGAGAILALICVLFGAFIMFRGTRAVPGPGFFTGEVPKGTVFSIPDALDAPDFPDQTDAEANVLKKTELFLKKLGGG